MYFRSLEGQNDFPRRMERMGSEGDDDRAEVRDYSEARGAVRGCQHTLNVPERHDTRSNLVHDCLQVVLRAGR